MSMKEYITLHIVLACLTMLTIETVKTLSLPTQKNIEIILSK